MSNVHGLGEYQSHNSPPQSQQRRQFMPNMNQMLNTGKNPRKENLFDFLKFTCCPQFKMLSFIAIISLVDIVVFCLTLSYGVETGKEGNEFLQVKREALEDFGGDWPYRILENFQIWRFVTPIFLHAHFLHIFMNLFIQIIYGTQLEAMFGYKKIAIIYFASGIGGNLWSDLMSKDVCFIGPQPVAVCISVGASGAIFGLFGVCLGFYIMEWNKIDPRIRQFGLCWLMFLIFLNLFGGLNSTNINMNAHLGGLFIGTFCGTLLSVEGISLFNQNSENSQQQRKNMNIGQKYALLIIIGFFVAGFLIFFWPKIAGNDTNNTN